MNDEAAPELGVGPREVLEYLRREANRPLKAKELARELGVETGEPYHAFRELLRELEADGLVYRQRKGRYAVPENLNLAIGRLQVTRAGDAFVLTEPEKDDVFVPGHLRFTAVEGDLVVARVEKRRPGRNPEGRVIRVLQRAYRQVVAIYHPKRDYGFAVPQEPPLGTDFFIPPGFQDEAEEGDVVLVEVVDWGETDRNPVGRIERVIGRPGEPGVDVLSIVLGHQLPLEFPEEVTREAERVAERGIRDEDMEEREDFRDRLILTIDPADAKDFDDALSVRDLGHGRVEVGVHIADVSHFVEDGSALAAEAQERATSVYLVDRVVPMLPHALSSDLCSLVPGEERLALSVIFDMDGGGEVRDARVAKTVIRSRHRLTYDEAQEILDGGPAPHELHEALKRLHGVSRGIRRRREARGSIDFDLPESRVVLNAAGEPTDIQRVMRLASHLMIEDLMILANETVAQLALHQDFPLIFRIHEEPSEEKLEGLRTLAATFGYHLPQRKVTPSDLARLLSAMEGTPQEPLISIATLRSMMQARYSVENVGHFGLASDAYAHFTSPIRRYPDLVVHRQLSRWLRASERARRTEVEQLVSVATHCSVRERRAVEAERDSVDLKKIEFMERHLGDEFDGTVSGVTAFGFFVLLDEYHVEGLVHVSTLEDDYYVFLEEQHALVGRRRRRRFQLGGRVRVQVARVDREVRKIDFELLEGGGRADGGRAD